MRQARESDMMSASRRDGTRLVHSLSRIERDEKQSRNDMAQIPSEIIDVLDCWNRPCIITHCGCGFHLPEDLSTSPQHHEIVGAEQLQITNQT